MKSHLFISRYINISGKSYYSIYNMTKLVNIVSETPKVMALENFFRLVTLPKVPTRDLKIFPL